MFEEILEKINEWPESEEAEAMYNPEKNIRSKMIDMFYKEGYSLADELVDNASRHLEFKKGDSIIKVVIPS